MNNCTPSEQAETNCSDFELMQMAARLFEEAAIWKRDVYCRLGRTESIDDALTWVLEQWREQGKIDAGSADKLGDVFCTTVGRVMFYSVLWTNIEAGGPRCCGCQK